ncbi:MAG: SpoIID/LytB domain-containing protein [Patescibacteria group bacterium]
MRAKTWAILFLLSSFFFLFTPVFAECPPTDYDCQIAQLQKEYDARREAHEKNKISLSEYEKELTNINKKLASIEIKLKNLELEIKEREVDLAFQGELLAVRVRSFYIKSRQFSPILVLLSSRSAQELRRELAFRQQAVNFDRKVITQVSLDLASLNQDKKTLMKSKSSLSSLKKQVDEQVKFYRGEVEKTEAFFAQILAKQQELQALKAGGFATSVGEVPPADDPASRPDFNPGFSPAFAAFSFGAPHRKGMSQYGAFGRAKAGQNAEEILRAYYGDVRIETRESPSTISTAVGTLPFEDNYMKGIAEMPSSWADEGGYEALKAQAIAARTYALTAGKPICITEACQVYSSTKVVNPAASRWHQAVSETRNKVIVSNSTGNLISSWYASTSGGYIFSYSSLGHSTPGFWDTSRGRDGWTDESWEKKAGSPWFYKAWYRKRSGDACGRSHPWLTQEEFADILNSLLIYKGNPGDVSHLSSLDAKSCFGKEISETWDMGKVREEAGKYGGSISRIDSVSVVYSNDGYTQTVSFGTNIGTKSFSGEDFKYIFNLRVPAAIGLKSSLFNLMKK